MNAPDFFEKPLMEAVDRATVYFPPGACRGGTGFLIGPKQVLTCAHVVAASSGRAPSAPIGLQVGAAGLTGTVRAMHPSVHTDETLWPHPDLALVEIDGEVPDGTGWLSLTETVADLSGRRLFVSGHNRVYTAGVRGASRFARFDGWDGREMRLADCELPPGNSGGPVLDLERAEICAIVTTARLPQTAMGGLAVPVGAVQSFLPDAWQRSVRQPNPLWEDLRKRVLEYFDPLTDVLTPTERSQLEAAATRLGLGEREYAEIYTSLAGEFAPVLDRPLRSLAELARELADTMAGLRLHPAITLADRIADRSDPETASNLRWQAAHVAKRFGPEQEDLLRRLREEAARSTAGQNAAGTGGPIVTVRIERLRIGSALRYHVEAWSYSSPAAGPRTELCLDDAVPGRAMSRLVRGAVVSSLTRLPPGNLMIEFALSRTMLVEAVERWHLGDRARPLGISHPVVLRCADRDVSADYVWRTRGTRLGLDPLAGTVHWLKCGEKRDRMQLNGLFNSEPGLSALVLADGWARHPSAAMQAALNAGLPVVIWRRGRCAHDKSGTAAHDPSVCCGEQFEARLRTALDGVMLRDLPECVRRLRAAAMGSAPPDPNHPGHEIAMMWDDPRRVPWAAGRDLADPARRGGTR